MAKKYDGYQSYDYLEKNLDYRPFKLASDTDRVEAYQVKLTVEQKKDTMNLLRII